MRVLLLFSSGELGGAERSLSHMAFAPSNIDYQLATLSNEGAWSDWVRSKGYEPLILGSSASVGVGLMLTSFWRLIRYLKQNPVDVIYVCGLRAAFVLRFLCLFFPKIKLVHGVRWNPVSDSRLDHFFRFVERFTYPLVDAWVTNSAIAKKTLVDRCSIPAERIFVIYNGLELLPKNTLLLNERAMEVLTVANLSPRKGYFEYLSVIKEVVKTLPNVRFVFVGRDDMDGEVQQNIEKEGLGSFVRYEGFQADISKWYRQARLFVLPSLRGEGCPTSILEAFSYNLPIVAYAIDGVPELVSDQHDGMLIDQGDTSAFGRAIKLLISQVEMAQKMGEEGRNKVQQNFIIERCADEHSACFSNILNKKSD
jgi:glycosyltransferase involved in cell wall biosynthesis